MPLTWAFKGAKRFERHTAEIRAGLVECRTPGTKGYQRVQAAVRRLSGQHYRNRYGGRRGKIGAVRKYVLEKAFDGGEFTSADLASWLAENAHNIAMNTRTAASFLSRHRDELGLGTRERPGMRNVWVILAAREAGG